MRIGMLHGAFGPVHPFHVAGWARSSAGAVAVEVRLDGGAVGTADAGADGRFGVATRVALPIYELHRLEVVAKAQDGTSARLGYAAPPPAELRYPLPASDATQRPVFVLGSMRSGTTAVMHALSSRTRFAGPGEGHLLDLSMRLYMLVQQVYAERRPMREAGLDTLITAVPEAFLLDGIRHCFVELAKARFPGGHWLDKTPTADAILAAPLLRTIWPEARFLFLKRRGIENVLSQARRFPDFDFERACRNWANSMACWRAVQGHLGAAAIEIEHLDLARDPDGTAGRIGGLLSLTAPERDGVRHALAFARPEQSTDAFAAVRGLASTGWTPGEVDTFRRLCGGAMRDFGYSEDASYLAGPG